MKHHIRQRSNQVKKINRRSRKFGGGVGEAMYWVTQGEISGYLTRKIFKGHVSGNKLVKVPGDVLYWLSQGHIVGHLARKKWAKKIERQSIKKAKNLKRQ